MHRELLATYALVLGGMAVGLLVAIFFVESEPRALSWVFGAGAGTMVGAFIAAISSNVPLAGGGSSRHEPIFPPPRPASEAQRHGSSNGHGGTNGHAAAYDTEDAEQAEGDESVRRGGRSG